MAGQLLPPPELDPPMNRHLSISQRIDLWRDLNASLERILIAALRRRIGPDGDLDAAYQQWYNEWVEEHDEMMVRLCRRLSHDPNKD